MTMDEIRLSDKVALVPEDLQDAIGINAQSLRSQAQVDPSKIGFPVCVLGTRVKIPRIPFLRFWGVDIK